MLGVTCSSVQCEGVVIYFAYWRAVKQLYQLYALKFLTIRLQNEVLSRKDIPNSYQTSQVILLLEELPCFCETFATRLIFSFFSLNGKLSFNLERPCFSLQLTKYVQIINVIVSFNIFQEISQQKGDYLARSEVAWLVSQQIYGSIQGNNIVNQAVLPKFYLYTHMHTYIYIYTCAHAPLLDVYHSLTAKSLLLSRTACMSLWKL